MSETLYAEDLGHYWETSRADPDRWIEKAKKQIEEIGGSILRDAYGSDRQTGIAAYMIVFTIGKDHFKIVWPVLPSKKGKTVSAKRQAATMLFHRVKSSCMIAAVLGPRTAFYADLMFPDGGYGFPSDRAGATGHVAQVAHWEGWSMTEIARRKALSYKYVEHYSDIVDEGGSLAEDPARAFIQDWYRMVDLFKDILSALPEGTEDRADVEQLLTETNEHDEKLWGARWEEGEEHKHAIE